MDEDQAFDASENMLNNKEVNKNTITFERIRDATTFYVYCAAESLLHNKSFREKTNKACELFNGAEYPSFIGASVKQDRLNKTLKIIRLGFTTRDDADRAMAAKFPDMDTISFKPLVAPSPFKFDPDLSIKVTEIPISTSEQIIRSTFARFGTIVRCSMMTKNLWQQATISYASQTDFSFFKINARIFVLKDMVRVYICSLTSDEI